MEFPEPNAGPPRYSTLGVDEIRIVHLQPGEPKDVIRCNLENVVLDSVEDRYQALSYVWGNTTALYPIILNGRTHQITGNLFAALHRLRLRKEIRTVWIDALCIDQSNITERNKQVRMMQRIYALSEECLVFLGDHSSFDFSMPRKTLQRSSDAIGNWKANEKPAPRSRWWRKRAPTVAPSYTLQRYLDTNLVEDPELAATLLLYLMGEHEPLELQIFKCISKHAYRIKDQYLRAFHTLGQWFLSPWWDRIWVIQESVLPKKLSAICGSYLVSWEVLVGAANSLYNASLQRLSDLSSLPPMQYQVLENIYTKVLELETLRTIRSHGRDMGVLELLWTYRHRQATDPRDHVHALNGLLPGHFAVARIRPDYNLDARETFIQLAVNMIATNGSLDVLVGAGLRDNTLNLPSWVQDWTYPGEVESHYGPYRYLAAIMRGVADVREQNGQVSQSFIIGHYSREGSVLLLPSTQVGIIETVGDVMQRHDGPEAFKDVYREWLALSRINILLKSSGPREAWENMATSNESQSNDWLRSENASFWQTINYGLRMNTNGKILGLRAPEVFRALDEDNFPSKEKLQSLISDPQPGHADFAAVELLTHKRRFFITQDGVFGLGPAGIQVGDEIHFLPRGRVPFVLRSLLLQKQEGSCSCPEPRTPCYALVGDCYLGSVAQGDYVEVKKEPWGRIHLH